MPRMPRKPREPKPGMWKTVKKVKTGKTVPEPEPAPSANRPSTSGSGIKTCTLTYIDDDIICIPQTKSPTAASSLDEAPSTSRIGKKRTNSGTADRDEDFNYTKKQAVAVLHNKPSSSGAYFPLFHHANRTAQNKESQPDKLTSVKNIPEIQNHVKESQLDQLTSVKSLLEPEKPIKVRRKKQKKKSLYDSDARYLVRTAFIDFATTYSFKVSKNVIYTQQIYEDFKESCKTSLEKKLREFPSIHSWRKWMHAADNTEKDKTSRSNSLRLFGTHKVGLHVTEAGVSSESVDPVEPMLTSGLIEDKKPNVFGIHSGSVTGFVKEKQKKKVNVKYLVGCNEHPKYWNHLRKIGVMESLIAFTKEEGSDLEAFYQLPVGNGVRPEIPSGLTLSRWMRLPEWKRKLDAAASEHYRKQQTDQDPLKDQHLRTDPSASTSSAIPDDSSGEQPYPERKRMKFNHEVTRVLPPIIRLVLKKKYGFTNADAPIRANPLTPVSSDLVWLRDAMLLYPDKFAHAFHHFLAICKNRQIQRSHARKFMNDNLPGIRKRTKTTRDSKQLLHIALLQDHEKLHYVPPSTSVIAACIEGNGDWILSDTINTGLSSFGIWTHSSVPNLRLPWPFDGKPSAKNLKKCVDDAMEFYQRDKEAVMYHYVANKTENAPRNTVYCVCADRSFVQKLPEGRPPLAWFLGNTMKGSYVGHGNYNRAVQHILLRKIHWAELAELGRDPLEGLTAKEYNIGNNSELIVSPYYFSSTGNSHVTEGSLIFLRGFSTMDNTNLVHGKIPYDVKQDIPTELLLKIGIFAALNLYTRSHIFNNV